MFMSVCIHEICNKWWRYEKRSNNHKIHSKAVEFIWLSATLIIILKWTNIKTGQTFQLPKAAINVKTDMCMFLFSSLKLYSQVNLTILLFCTVKICFEDRFFSPFCEMNLTLFCIKTLLKWDWFEFIHSYFFNWKRNCFVACKAKTAFLFETLNFTTSPRLYEIMNI